MTINDCAITSPNKDFNGGNVTMTLAKSYTDLSNKLENVNVPSLASGIQGRNNPLTVSNEVGAIVMAIKAPSHGTGLEGRT